MMINRARTTLHTVDPFFRKRTESSASSSCLSIEGWLGVSFHSYPGVRLARPQLAKHLPRDASITYARSCRQFCNSDDTRDQTNKFQMQFARWLSAYGFRCQRALGRLLVLNKIGIMA